MIRLADSIHSAQILEEIVPRLRNSTNPSDRQAAEVITKTFTSPRIDASLHLQWENPDISHPSARDQYLTVDQASAQENINQYLVLTGALDNANCVLDIGCGSGYSTYALHTKGNKDCYFLGVDIPRNIEFAKTKYNPWATHNNLNYKPISTSQFELPYDPAFNGWNIITALTFFSQIPLESHIEVLKKMYRALADNGKILIRTQAVRDRLYRRAAHEIMQEPKWSGYFESYDNTYHDQTAEQMAQFLRDAGFVDVHTTFRQDTSYFPTKDAMTNYFLQWLPQLSAIKSDRAFETYNLKRSFTKEVIDRYCTLINNTGIDIPFKSPCILATATKPKQETTWTLIKV